MKKTSDKVKFFISDKKLLLIIAVIVIFITITDKNFLNIINILKLFDHIAIDGILAVGMTVLMISGVFDLSVGSVMSLSGIVTIMLQPLGLITSILIGILVGILVGIINGILTTIVRIQAFIATLGTMIFIKGVALAITNSYPVSGTLKSFNIIYSTSFFHIPIFIFYLIAAYCLGWFLLKYTRFGKYSYAIGGNEASSILAGINVNLYKILYFVFCSSFASIAGILLSSKTNTGSAVVGDNVPLIIIASVVLGGTSLSGGKGKILNTLLGILIFGLISKAMVYLNIDQLYQYIFRGLIIIIVVLTDRVSNREKLNDY